MWTIEERIERPVPEIAGLLHIAERTLYAAIQLGDLKAVRRGDKGGRAVTTLAWVYEWQDASASTTNAPNETR